MNSNQRKKARMRMQAETARDDSRAVAKLPSSAPIGKGVARRGRVTVRQERAAQYLGSGPWTSFPFHHGKTFIRRELADTASKRPL